jgi:hypothetical protein
MARPGRFFDEVLAHVEALRADEPTTARVERQIERIKGARTS